MNQLPICVVVSIKNEEANLPECLSRLSGFEDVVVVDSDSSEPETFGSGYLNFGVIGIAVFALIKGFISGLAYSYARALKFSPPAMFILLYIAFSFHLTNLRIVECSVVVIGALSLAPVLRLIPSGRARA